MLPATMVVEMVAMVGNVLNEEVRGAKCLLAPRLIVLSERRAESGSCKGRQGGEATVSEWMPCAASAGVESTAATAATELDVDEGESAGL